MTGQQYRRTSQLVPVWALVHLLLLCSLECVRGVFVGTDIKLDLGPHLFNPSLVQLEDGSIIAGARTSWMRQVATTVWWHNAAYMCGGATVVNMTCQAFDPWRGSFKECLFGRPTQVPKFDMNGIEDPKFFRWPGRGVYALLGRKPPQTAVKRYCSGHVVFQQYLWRVGGHGDPGPWNWPEPLKLVVKDPEVAYKGKYYIKEKNWMPFVLNDNLYVVHSLLPHRVYRMGSDGRGTDEFLTDSTAVFYQHRNRALHGGPPLLRMPAEVTGKEADFFLGVAHFFTMQTGLVRHYHHYFYKMQAVAPFHICALSNEIELTFTPEDPRIPMHKRRIWRNRSNVAFISGLEMSRESHVLVSYGSGDEVSRLLVLLPSEVESLFTGRDFCAQPITADEIGGGQKKKKKKKPPPPPPPPPTREQQQQEAAAADAQGTQHLVTSSIETRKE